MNHKLFFFAVAIFVVFLINPAKAQVSATSTLGGSGTYTTLKGAIDAVNSAVLKGVITIEISANTTEATMIELKASGTLGSDWTSIKIYPTQAGITISSTIAANHVLNIAGSNVTIDGSIGGAGTDKNLTIVPVGTSTFSTIAFQNDASNNTVKNCIVKAGVCTSGRAAIAILNATSTGSDNITISNNDFTSVAVNQKPVAAVYAVGAAGKEINNLEISNNNFYDLFMQTNFTNATLSIAVYLNGYVSGAIIDGNSFYETASFTAIPTFSVSYVPIYVKTATNSGIQIKNNYIGGSQPQCGGSPMSILATTDANALTASFIGINIEVGAGTASSVQNNTIKNIAFRSTTSGGTFTGINVTSTCTGNVNIGTETGNKIGDTGTTSITFTGQKAAGGNSVYGIANAGTGLVNITGNTVGGIDAASSIAGALGDLIGIYANGANASGTNDVNKNFVAGLTTTGSLATVYAIRANKGTVNYVNNIVSLKMNTATTMYGIFETGVTATNNNIYFNTVNIDGSPTSGANASYALFSNSTNGTRDIRNNILNNIRSGGTGKHYAVRLAGTTGLTDCNANNYYTGVNFLAAITTADYSSLGAWQGITTKDGDSKNTDPVFKLSGSNTASDFETKSTVNMNGKVGTGITTDYTGGLRTIPVMGAYETQWLGTKLNNFELNHQRIIQTTNGIIVPLSSLSSIELYTANGMLLNKANASGSYQFNISKGCYLLRINGIATKFVKL